MKEFSWEITILMDVEPKQEAGISPNKYQGQGDTWKRKF